MKTEHVSSGSRFLERAQMTLHAVQCHLDIQGASALIVHLVIKSANTAKIFHEVISKSFAKENQAVSYKILHFYKCLIDTWSYQSKIKHEAA